MLTFMLTRGQLSIRFLDLSRQYFSQTGMYILITKQSNLDHQNSSLTYMVIEEIRNKEFISIPSTHCLSLFKPMLPSSALTQRMRNIHKKRQ